MWWSVATLLLVCVYGESVKNVHVVFMNHLDVGFNFGYKNEHSGWAADVLNQYMNVYFPNSLITAEAGRKDGHPFIYTTHPFLLWVLERCNDIHLPKLHCPNATVVQQIEDGVKNGDIYFHAFPHNAELEVYDTSLLEAQLQIPKRLAHKFGVKPPTVMSQRDVPGTTRAAIQILKKHGVKALTVGVNGSSMPPKVPKLFLWYDEATQETLLAMWHPYGYGGINKRSCVVYKDVALAFAFKGDNAGPQTPDDVNKIYEKLKLEYPHANIRASTYDAFVDDIINLGVLNDSSIPVVTDEIGDTWIHGVAADPIKQGGYRAVLRARSTICGVDGSKCNLSDPAMELFDGLLGKIPEHTWGSDIKTYLHDWQHWSNKEFYPLQYSADNYKYVTYSWLEQRMFLDLAIAAVKDENKPLYDEIQKQLKSIEAVEPAPNTTGYSKVPKHSWRNQFTCDNVKFQFELDGSLSTLQLGGGYNWATADHLIGQVRYQTEGVADYDKFLLEYWNKVVPGPSFPHDFGKYDFGVAHPKHATYSGDMVELWKTSDSCSFMSRLNYPEFPHITAGAPSYVWMTVNITANRDRGKAMFDVQWYNKTATRLPEAMFFSVNASIPMMGGTGDPSFWRIQKLNSSIDPTRVVEHGACHLHSVMSPGITYNANNKYHFGVDSVDTGLLSIELLSPFSTPIITPSDPNKGLHYIMVDNIWGTNYPMWYPFKRESSDQNSRFHYTVEFS